MLPMNTDWQHAVLVEKGYEQVWSHASGDA
jgi:hypothetical protein